MTKLSLPSLSLALAFPFLTGCFGSGHKEIQNLGSDTLLEVAGSLAEAYHELHPEIAISVSGGGSGVGIKNLIDGDVDIANSSRPLKEKEIEAAKNHGHDPVQHVVGYDGIAIFVHKENPLESITIAQLQELFGDGGKIDSWKDLGVDFGSPEANEVVLASRQNNSGTYECFREHVLGENGRFKMRCNNLNGSKDVVDFCAKTKSAIGYSGIAYATDQVKIVPVSASAESPPVVPSIDTVLDKTYPIARPLFMYTIGEPEGDIAAYLDWIASDDGQQVLLKKGYIPLRKL
ncbi:MAG: phosphate ABC transporter substrate-binding protein [Planctomycetes bacterium]|nr:phosphate ABC transporter substrate-binding protein [Planctomycetota bacterium]